MKRRQGFVSNSSSSSFIVDMQDTRELAKIMIPKLENNGTKILKKFNRLLILNEDFVDNNTPIVFPSINYDTYIMPYKNMLIVDTCNNEGWRDKIDVPFETGCSEDFTSQYRYNNPLFFWDITLDIFFNDIVKEHTYCKDHFDYISYIFDYETMYCPKCYKGKTFTQRNKIARVSRKLYNGPNIRRYNYSRSFK